MTCPRGKPFRDPIDNQSEPTEEPSADEMARPVTEESKEKK